MQKKILYVNVISNLSTTCEKCGQPSIGGFDCDKDEVEKDDDDGFDPEEYLITTTCVNCNHSETFSAETYDLTMELHPVHRPVENKERIPQ